MSRASSASDSDSFADDSSDCGSVRPEQLTPVPSPRTAPMAAGQRASVSGSASVSPAARVLIPRRGGGNSTTKEGKGATQAAAPASSSAASASRAATPPSKQRPPKPRTGATPKPVTSRAVTPKPASQKKRTHKRSASVAPALSPSPNAPSPAATAAAAAASPSPRSSTRAPRPSANSTSVQHAVRAARGRRPWPPPRCIVEAEDGSDSEDYCFACREAGRFEQEESGHVIRCDGICATVWHPECLAEALQPPETPEGEAWFCLHCSRAEYTPSDIDRFREQGDWDETKRLPSSGVNVLMAALCIHDKPGREEFIRHLCTLPHVQHSIRTNQQDCELRTVLHHCAQNHVPARLVLLMLQHGSDPNVTDQYGNAPAHRAFSDQSISCVLALLTSPRINLHARAGKGGFAVFASCGATHESVSGGGGGGRYQTGLGPGLTTQGRKGYLRFQLFFAFAVVLTAMEEYVQHKHPHRAFVREKKSNKNSKKWVEAVDDAAAAPAAGPKARSGTDGEDEDGSDNDEEGDSQDGQEEEAKEPPLELTPAEAAQAALQEERQTLLRFLSNRLQSLSPRMLQFAYACLILGTDAAQHFTQKDFKPLSEAQLQEHKRRRRAEIQGAEGGVGNLIEGEGQDMELEEGEITEEHKDGGSSAIAASSPSPPPNPSRRGGRRRSKKSRRDLSGRVHTSLLADHMLDCIAHAALLPRGAMPACVEERMDKYEAELQSWFQAFDSCAEFAGLSTTATEGPDTGTEAPEGAAPASAAAAAAASLSPVAASTSKRKAASLRGGSVASHSAPTRSTKRSRAADVAPPPPAAARPPPRAPVDDEWMGEVEVAAHAQRHNSTPPPLEDAHGAAAAGAAGAHASSAPRVPSHVDDRLRGISPPCVPFGVSSPLLPSFAGFHASAAPMLPLSLLGAGAVDMHGGALRSHEGADAMLMEESPYRRASRGERSSSGGAGGGHEPHAASGRHSRASGGGSGGGGSGSAALARLLAQHSQEREDMAARQAQERERMAAQHAQEVQRLLAQVAVEIA